MKKGWSKNIKFLQLLLQPGSWTVLTLLASAVVDLLSIGINCCGLSSFGINSRRLFSIVDAGCCKLSSFALAFTHFSLQASDAAHYRLSASTTADLDFVDFRFVCLTLAHTDLSKWLKAPAIACYSEQLHVLHTFLRSNPAEGVIIF